MPILMDYRDQVPGAEQARKENCASSGFPGGQNGGSIVNGIGALTAGACFNGLISEQARIQQQLSDIEACLDAMSPKIGGDRGPDVSFAVVAVVGPIITGGSIIVAVGDRIIAHERAKVAAFEKAVEKVGPAVDKFRTATKAVKDAQANVDKANAKEDAAMDERSELEDAGASEEDVEAAEQRVRDAEKERREAENARDNAKEAQKTAEDEAKKAIKDAQQKAPVDPVGPDEAGGNPLENEACIRAFFGTDDPEIIRTFLREWLIEQDPNDPLTYPNPDEDPGPESLLDHAFCGLDSNTIGNRSGHCKLPVLCDPGSIPDENCQCSVADSDSTRLLQLQNLACSATAICLDGSVPRPDGMLCVCGDEEQGDGPLWPEPQPLPYSSVIDTFFENPALGTVDSLNMTDLSNDPAGTIMQNTFLGTPLEGSE